MEMGRVLPSWLQRIAQVQTPQAVAHISDDAAPMS
jgi:hypothetical protein